jgi:outer membrane receptor protein involved in Fe transport
MFMKKASVVILLTILFSTLSFGREIRGRVTNAQGKSIAEAVVIHRQSGNKALTDEEGNFILEAPVPEGAKIQVEVIHPDYFEELVTAPVRGREEPLRVVLVPLIRQREEVVVTALRYPEPSSVVPAAGSVIPAETLAEKMVPNITSGLSGLPGVSSLGSGGFSLVPNIRGFARNRVLIMVDNARISSDRRTGPNASFVIPEDIARIEVLRSSSSIFYGSDAVGGVVHLFTKKTDFSDRTKGELQARYGTVNAEKGAGFSLQGSKRDFGFYISFQGIDAEDYSTPSGTALQSRFSQGSLFGKISHKNAKREIDLSFLGSRGRDIGKTTRASLTNPTWYPREDQNLIQFHWLERNIGGGEVSWHAYLNPNFLETKSEKLGNYKTQESYSKTQSTDYGFQLSYGKKPARNFRWNGGLDFYGRSGVRADNKDISFDSQGNVTKVFKESPYTGGERHDYGIFISGDYNGLRNFDLAGGIRLDYLAMRANPGGASLTLKSHHAALTGFLAGSLKLTPNLIGFVNLSRAYRAPGLGEKFYSGITGRGVIIAQPNLRPETSLNLDGGLKFIAKRFFAGLYSFTYQVDDMIERYLVAERTYTYGNVLRGKIRGLEMEAELYPLQGWKLFGNVFAIKGTSAGSAARLNDIPPLSGFLGTKVWVKTFSFEVDCRFQQKKDTPGPAEVAIPGYATVDLKANYLFGSSLSIYSLLSNLFNKAYLGRPDPDAVEEPGRNFILGISYSF